MLEVVGPTLPDLKDHVNADYEEISRALAAKSAGLFIGAIIGGVLHEKFHRHTDLIMSLGILIGAVGISMVPWVATLPAVSFFLLLTGVSEGFINTGKQISKLKTRLYAMTPVQQTLKLARVLAVLILSVVSLSITRWQLDGDAHLARQSCKPDAFLTFWFCCGSYRRASNRGQLHVLLRDSSLEREHNEKRHRLASHC